MTEELETSDTNEKAIADALDFKAKDIPDIDSKYRLILLAAQRAKQIQRGAIPRVDLDPRKIKPTTIALEEFEEDKVNFRFTEREKG
jgi:DNA-directed RNA polymerase omega subunit